MWTPPLTELQLQFYLSRKRIRMVYGARCSGKTIAVEHSVMRHLWRNHARVAVITKTNRQGAYGVWPELTEQIYDTWRGGGLGSKNADFGWSREPWKDDNKINQALLYNRHGGISKLVLFPIEDAREARDKLMSTQWSMVWISEGHLYRGRTPDEMLEQRQILDTAISQLRYAPCPFEERQVLIDTNPPDEGTEHWLYPPFFTELEWLKNEEWPEHFTPEVIEAKRLTIPQMERLCMPIESNTYLHPLQKAEIIATYSNDPFLYRRYVKSEWINGTTKGVFSGVFSQVKHVLGNADSKDEMDWQVIAPSNGLNVHVEEGLPLIITGWDLGEVNHAWVAAQPIYVGNKLHFRVLDELVVIKEMMTIEEFTAEVMKRMDALEAFAGFKLNWKHFSDSSAFEFKAAINRKDLPEDSDLTDAAVVYAASKKRIFLEGSANVKKPGWVRRRVAFMSQILREGRIKVSANCKMVIEMFRNLRKGDRKEAIDPEQPNKHAHDALSYCISMFCLEEIGQDPQTTSSSNRRATVSYA